MKRYYKSEKFIIEESTISDPISNHELPFCPERRIDNGDIVWYGYNCNWKFFNDKWYKLQFPNWVECDTPEYELLYMEIYKDKFRNLKIKKILNNDI